MDNDGYIQRKNNGKYEGSVNIHGIELPSITATFFTKDNKNYLWLKRKDVMEYDYESSTYITRKAEPQWECYLEKQVNNDVVAYRGEFVFMRFKFSIVGIWDAVLGRDEQRLNLYVERLPMSQQTILRGINEIKRKH